MKNNNIFRRNTAPPIMSITTIRMMLITIMLGASSVFTNLMAQVNITAPSLSVTASCKFPTPYAALGNIVITETATTDFATTAGGFKTLILTAPTNFSFKTALGSVSNTSADITNLSISVIPSKITVTFKVVATSVFDIITISSIQVRGNGAPSGPSDLKRPSGIAGGNAIIFGDANGAGVSHATFTSVATDPTVSVQPVPLTPCEGISANFSLSTFVPPDSYQWEEDQNLGAGFVALPEAYPYSNVNTSLVTIADGIISMSGFQYRCILSGADGGCISDTAILTVNNPPAITSDPIDITVCQGGNTSFSVEATGAGLIYNWLVSSDGGFNFNPVILAPPYSLSGNSLLITTVPLSFNNYLYHCIVGGTCEPQPVGTTTPGKLTVNPAALVSAGPDASVCSGSAYTIPGSIGGGASSSLWTTSGDGTFNDSSIVNAVYTPSAADSAIGIVNLIITTNDPAGPCLAVADTMDLTIKPAAIVAAGLNDTICNGSTYSLSGSIGGGASSSTWTSSGDGAFNDSSLVNAVYTPGSGDSTLGTVTLTLTTNNPIGICPAVFDAMILTINPIAIVTAGLNDTICSGTTSALSGAIGGGASTATWTTSGDGTFNDSSLVNAIYTHGSADSTNGTVTLTLTTDDPAGPCPLVFDAMFLTIKPAAIVTAGLNDTICSGSTYTLSGAIGGGALSSIWTTSGNGTFNDSSIVNAVYTYSTNDSTLGTVTLTITTDNPVGVCPAVIDAMALTINPAAVVTAGLNDTICSGSNYTLSGAIDGGASSSTWTTSGDGTFNDSSLVNAVYTPGSADSALGTVTLTITTNDPIGPCPAVFDAIVLTINPAVIVTAGLNDTICSGSTYTLSGAIGGGATSSVWTTSGDGVFNDSSLVNAIYTHGSNDSTLGTITLTITTDDPAGICPPAVDSMFLTINPAPIVTAGLNDTICSGSAYPLVGIIGGGATSSTWTTSGDGTFNDSSIVNAIYTNGSADSVLGTVFLIITSNDPIGVCLAAVDSMTLAINPAVIATAGLNDTICSGSTYPLSGSIGGGATSSVWTTPGDGIFNDSSLVNAVYTPGATDISNGTVTLNIITDDPAGACLPAIDSMVLTINPAVIVTAGLNDTICSGSASLLAGTIGGGATFSTWTTSGDGTFNDSSLVNAIYTHGSADSVLGSLFLIITSNDPIGVCPAAVDSMMLTINPAVIVAAGLNDTICSGSTYPLSGSIGGGASSATWSTSGDGTFNDSSIVNAVYTPGATDITNGTVTLTITSDDPIGTCPAAVDSMLLAINPAAIVTAGLNDSICSGSMYILSGSRLGSATSSTWTTSGDGTFSDSSLVNAIYIPGATDLTNGSVFLIITSNDPIGICTASVDSLTLSIGSKPIVVTVTPATLCSPATINLTLPAVTFGSTAGLAFNYYTDSTATISYPTPTTADSGTYYITGQTVFGCSDTTAVIVTVNPKPTLVITDPAPVCLPTVVNLTLPAITAGSTPGLALSYFMDSVANTIMVDSANVILSGTYYIVGIVPATGCSDTSAVIVSIDAAAVGGIVVDDALVCSGANGDTLTLTGYSGTIEKWQYSVDGGTNWIDIANTTNKQFYSNIIITTWYRAIVSAFCSTGPSVEARITVDSTPLPIGGTVASNDTVCSGSNYDTLTLTGHTGNIIRWEYSTDGGNTWVYINNTGTTLIYNNLTTTTIYHAVVQNSFCGFAFSSSDTITVTPPSIAGSISGSIPGCAYSNGGTLTLGGYSGAIVTWQYSTDAGTTWIDTANITNTQVYANIPDTIFYRAIVKSGVCNKDTSASVSIIVYPKPIALFTADTVCLGGPTTFVNASTIASGFIQFNQWDFGDNISSLSLNPTHTYAQSGLVTVNLVVTSDFSCLDTATISVLVDPLPNEQIIVSGPLSFCCGGSVSLSAVGGLNYLWSTTATTQGIVVNNCLASGLYTLTVTNPATLCTNNSAVTIVIFPIPVANAGNDTTISLGSSYTLNGQGGTIYLWNPATGLSNPAIPDPVASPLMTTTYELTATDINGCMDIDSLTITVITDYNVIVTNLMTTNGDGFNDKWIVKNIENYPGTEAIVVNREGQQVYYSSSYDNSWEGLNKDGKPLPDGTYYYFLKFKNNNKLYKGPLTILNEK